MGKLIIIEGSDGSGKQTQTTMIYERLLKEKYDIKKISFPNYSSPSSSLVKMYLNGDFGNNASDVNAYSASSFYSVDRYASFKMDWSRQYNDGYIIISDRYTTSNMVHQTSKIKDELEKEKYLEWLEDFEFKKLGLPIPDLIIFLNVPIEYSLQLMKDRENKITGEYKKDIHERDENYLRLSYNNALKIADDKNWIVINCIKDNEMRTIEDINDEIYLKIKEIL